MISEDTRKKLSLAKLGKPRSGNPKNWKHSEATKNKLSIFNKDHGIVPPSRKGCKASEETREKMRNRVVSEDTRRKLSGRIPWNKGVKWIRMTGANNSRWVEDRTKLKTDREKAYDTRYKYWMLDVKNRDGWKCKISNGNCSGRLEAHHILGWKDHPELRYQINNGITLCHAHHPRKRAEEKRLSPYFMELVSVSSEQ